MNNILIFLWLIVLLLVQAARADFTGPSVATHAISPNGELLVRIKTGKGKVNSQNIPEHEVTFYVLDAAKDSYVRNTSASFTGYLAQMLYLSNEGDLIFVSLDETEAIRLYSKDGKLRKSWDLADFLTKDEIKSCAKTGSTLQWLEEGAFDDRTFSFYGPSRRIRALSPPLTVMRGANFKVTFSGSINAVNAELKKHARINP